MTKKPDSIAAKIVASINKKLGNPIALRLGDDNARSEVGEVIPTGLTAVDHYLFGVGGIPVGRIGELFSEEGAGKSAFALHCLAACQRAGGVAVLIETEQGFSEERCITYGIDTEALVIAEPETMDDVLTSVEVALDALPSPPTSSTLIVWDSLASIGTKREMDEGLMGHEKMGERAKVLSHAMRILPKLLIAKRAAMIIVNHTRTKFGVMFGDPTTTPGGAAVKFAASWRMRLYSGKASKEGIEHTGKAVTFSAMKNRFAPPYRKVRVHLDFAKGWDEQATLIEFAKDRKLLERGQRGEAAYDAALAACKMMEWKFTEDRHRGEPVEASGEDEDGEDAA